VRGAPEVLPVYEALCPADGVPDVTDLSDGDDVLSAAGPRGPPAARGTGR